VIWRRPTSLFQGRKLLSYNCLIVVEEAASSGTEATERTAKMATYALQNPALRGTTPAKKHVSGAGRWRNCNSLWESYTIQLSSRASI
jgi:hypothetical protein